MMLKLKIRWVFGALCYLALSSLGFGQDEQESAELTLEEYTDEFQEHFFEALKQEGIENYERAIEELFKCKELDPDNAVLDQEIAQSYFRLKNYGQAELFYKAALEKEPTNPFYLSGLFELYRAINDLDSAVSIANRIIKKDEMFKEELAEIYVRKRSFDKALALLEQLDNTYGNSPTRDSLRSRIKRIGRLQSVVESKTTEPIAPSAAKSELEQMLSELATLQKNDDFDNLLKKSNAALSLYPSQPKLYLYNGVALIGKAQYQKAIFSLESGLDYIIEDTDLELKFYSQLMQVFERLSDRKKYNEYKKKLKRIQQ